MLIFTSSCVLNDVCIYLRIPTFNTMLYAILDDDHIF